MKWPPPHIPGWKIVRRQGRRFWFGDPDRRRAGAVLMLLGFGLWIGAWLSAFFEDSSGDEGLRFGNIVLGAIVFLPVGGLGLWLALHHRFHGVLDLDRQHLERLHWRTGDVVETWPTRDLYLVVWSPRHGEASNEPEPQYVSASLDPEARGAEVTLWSLASRSYEEVEGCLDALQSVATWKGESGEKVRLFDRVAPGPCYPLRSQEVAP